jgi:hypothetical protein
VNSGAGIGDLAPVDEAVRLRVPAEVEEQRHVALRRREAEHPQSVRQLHRENQAGAVALVRGENGRQAASFCDEEVAEPLKD